MFQWSSNGNELAVELLMTCLSTFIDEGIQTLSDTERADLQRALVAGKLKLEIETPPLKIRVSTLDAGVDRHVFTAMDDRDDRWAAWARDLCRRTMA